MVTGLTALFVWLKSRNAERAPASAAMVVSPESGMARPIVLVDVRTPEEYRTGHKEGALNIPADEVEQRAAQLLPDKNAVILLYCRTGKRADKALEVLRKMGYSHVEKPAPVRNVTFRPIVPCGDSARRRACCFLVRTAEFSNVKGTEWMWFFLISKLNSELFNLKSTDFERFESKFSVKYRDCLF